MRFVRMTAFVLAAICGSAEADSGFAAHAWWEEKGDAIVAVLSNVGSQHAGKTMSTAKSISLQFDFTGLAVRFAGQHETRSSTPGETACRTAPA